MSVSILINILIRIHEIINENNGRYRGWDDSKSEYYPVKGTRNGFIIIARSFDENDILDKIMYNYYDKDIVGNTKIPAVGVRKEKDGAVREFIFGVDGLNGATRDIGFSHQFPNLYEYFMELVVRSMNKNIYLGENMNEKLTLKKFMEMNPEIVRALRAAENEFNDSCSKEVMSEDTTVNMSPYKNTEAPKSKAEHLIKK